MATQITLDTTITKILSNISPYIPSYQGLVEASISQNVNHPNVLTANEVTLTRDDVRIIYPRGEIASGKVRQLLLGVGRGIIYLHDIGVIHGDIKIDNIIMFGDTPKIIDYDHSTWINSGKKILGTDIFASPELSRGEMPSPADDVWSFGALILYIIVGHSTYLGETPETARDNARDALSNSTFPYNSDLPGDISGLLGMIFQPRHLRPTMRQVMAFLGESNIPPAILPIPSPLRQGEERRLLVSRIADIAIEDKIPPIIFLWMVDIADTLPDTLYGDIATEDTSFDKIIDAIHSYALLYLDKKFIILSKEYLVLTQKLNFYPRNYLPERPWTSPSGSHLLPFLRKIVEDNNYPYLSFMERSQRIIRSV